MAVMVLATWIYRGAFPESTAFPSCFAVNYKDVHPIAPINWCQN